MLKTNLNYFIVYNKKTFRYITTNKFKKKIKHVFEMFKTFKRKRSKNISIKKFKKFQI